MEKTGKPANIYSSFLFLKLQPEFRRLLGVSPRLSRVGEQVVLHERAEEVLRTHPDVAQCAYVGTRRDAHPGAVVAWVKLRDGVTATGDLAMQFRGGMSRMGGYRPQSAKTSSTAPALIRKAPTGLSQAEYGSIKLLRTG